MSRPNALSAEQQARIAASPMPPAALVRALAAEGVTVSTRTVQRCRARGKATEAPAAVGPGRDFHTALAGRRARDASAELADDDDLGRLARRRDEIDQALTTWQAQLSVSGGAVRAYRGLMAELAEVTRTLVELRPRREIEAERLEALGSTNRDRLLARAVAAADADETHALRERVADQQRAIETMRKVLAEGD